MKSRIGILALAIGLFLPEVLPAQIGRVIRRATNRAEANVNREIDRAVDQAVDCAMGDQRCVDEAQRDGRKVRIKDQQGNVITDASGNPVQDQAAAAAATSAPGTGVWRNYDFVRGDSIWVATDWSLERVGRVPASQIEFVAGNLEIVERDGIRLLEAKSSSTFRIKLPRALPQQFTLEMMLEVGAPHISTGVFFAPKAPSASREPWDYLYLFANSGIYRKGQAVSSATDRSLVGNLMPVQLQVDSAYAILYIGPTRVAQVPTVNFPRNDAIEFHVNANPGYPTYISDIIVAVGLDPLYDGLMRSGEVATHGILFDVASDRLRPESTPKLNELLEMLRRYGDLRVMIEGHTDSTGDDGTNQSLSERRAASVVTWLAGQGIDRSRLQSAGKGESVPVADNATEAGRQQNRRVVIRKM